MRAGLSVVALAVAVAAAVTIPGRTVLFNRTFIPDGWKADGPVPDETVIPFMVALTQRNLDVLNTKFWEVSDPNHVNYGKFMTSEEVTALTAASPEAMAAVQAFFKDARCSTHGDSMACTATAAVLSNLLQTKFVVMANVGAKDVKRKSIVSHMGPMSIPEELAEHITFITGLSAFPEPRPSHARAARAAAVTGTDYVVVPETITRLYQTTGATGSTASTQGVGEFQDEPAYDPADLTTFAKEVGITIAAPTKVGPFNPGADPESSLDIMYIGAVGNGNKNWFWTEAEWMYEFTQSFIAAAARPAVFSMSYAWSEIRQCQDIDPTECSTLGVTSQGYVERVNTEFQKIGVLGTSLLSASGDSGCHGRTNEDCTTSKKCFPAFPASSPYVTAVGGTQLENGVSQNPTSPICKAKTLECATGGYEIVSSTGTGAEISSGGGFSVYSARPAYQTTVVAKFLQNTTAIPQAADFNASGRGYPDVAALAHNYYIELSGAPNEVDGTSCSTPVFSGIVGLLNAARLAEGKPVIGFANPLLYQVYAEAPDAFTDVVQGNNYCTEDGCSCTNGFQATPGWDATTGLGTPVYPKLLAAIKAIDARREARIAALAH